MDTTSKRYIDVSKEVETKLAKLFKCTPTFVYMALTYRRDSQLARKVRYVAVRDYHGKPMHHCPVCETLHKLEVDKGTGDVVAYNRKGDHIGNWENVSVTKLSEIQLMAESL